MATSSLLALVVARPTVLAPPCLTQGFIPNNVDGSKGGKKASRENSTYPPPRNLPAFPCLSSRLVFFRNHCSFGQRRWNQSIFSLLAFWSSPLPPSGCGHFLWSSPEAPG